jgi:hypothetical protein
MFSSWGVGTMRGSTGFGSTPSDPGGKTVQSKAEHFDTNTRHQRCVFHYATRAGDRRTAGCVHLPTCNHSPTATSNLRRASRVVIPEAVEITAPQVVVGARGVVGGAAGNGWRRLRWSEVVRS